MSINLNVNGENTLLNRLSKKCVRGTAAAGGSLGSPRPTYEQVQGRELCPLIPTYGL